MDGGIEKKLSTERRIRIPGGSLIPPVLLVVLQFLPICPAINVTWLPNLEWKTGSNWEDNFVPENGTHVVFPVELRLSVGLPVRNAALDLAGIELPRDGVLALPESGFLQISEPKPTAKTARWSREGPLLWADPNNWRSDRLSAAVPHLERIPCQGDVVVLPGADRTFSIQLPNANGAKVQAVRVMNDTGNLPPWEWRNRRTQKEFSAGPRTVEYTGLRSCVDCPCQEKASGVQILEEVCKTKGATCQRLECDRPVRVEGHCCSYCGGRVVIPRQTSLSLANTAARMALGSYGSRLSWYVRRKWDSSAEILIAGNREYSQIDTASAVAALKSVLQEQGIQVLSSDVTGAEMRGSRTAAFLGPFFGTLLFAIILVLVALPYYGYPLPQVIGESWTGLRALVVTTREGSGPPGSAQPAALRKPFEFAKFENAPESEVELAGPSGSVSIDHGGVLDEEDDEELDGGGRFANPLYRSGRRAPGGPSFASLKKIHSDEEDEEIDLGIEP